MYLVEHLTIFYFRSIYIPIKCANQKIGGLNRFKIWGSVLRFLWPTSFCIKSELLTCIKSKQITSGIKSEHLTFQSTIRLYDLHPLIVFLPLFPIADFWLGPCIWIWLIPFFFVIPNYRAVNLKTHKRGKFENISGFVLYY